MKVEEDAPIAKVRCG